MPSKILETTRTPTKVVYRPHDWPELQAVQLSLALLQLLLKYQNPKMGLCMDINFGHLELSRKLITLTSPSTTVHSDYHLMDSFLA